MSTLGIRAPIDRVSCSPALCLRQKKGTWVLLLCKSLASCFPEQWKSQEGIVNLLIDVTGSIAQILASVVCLSFASLNSRGGDKPPAHQHTHRSPAKCLISSLIALLRRARKEHTGVLTIPAIRQKVAAVGFDRVFIAFSTASEEL